MNRIQSVGMLVVCLMCGTMSLQAQEAGRQQHRPERVSDNMRPPREVPSPEKEARKLTDRMKQELKLTDKQYKKLYKLNLKEQKERFKAMSAAPRPPMGEGPMGPGRGGPRPPMGEPPHMHRHDNVQDMEKNRVAKEKKIKKILTQEQYDKWQTARLPHTPQEETLSK